MIPKEGKQHSLRHLSVKFAIRTGEVLLSRGVEYRYAIKEKKKKKNPACIQLVLKKEKLTFPFCWVLSGKPGCLILSEIAR